MKFFQSWGEVRKREVEKVENAGKGFLILILILINFYSGSGL